MTFKKQVLWAYALSGGCSLVYQLVWYHYFVDFLGATGTTFLIVLCSFIGGLGLGAMVSQPVMARLSRLFHLTSLRLYGLVELLITAATVALIVCTRLSLEQLVGNAPYHPVQMQEMTLLSPDAFYLFLKIGTALLAVGLPCFLMGLTYPYLCSVFRDDGNFPSQLYAFNTMGACLSILATEFAGFVILGYYPVLLLALGVNTGIALLFLTRRNVPLNATPDAAPEMPRETAQPLSNYPAILSGFLCGGIEALTLTFSKLTYFSARGIFSLISFHAIAAIWLASSLVHKRHPGPQRLIIGAWISLGWITALWFLEPEPGYLLVIWFGEHLLAMSPYVKGVVVSFVYTAFLLSVPYFFWSTLLPSLCDAKQKNGEYLARAYGLNTLAFLAGTLLFGWGLQYVNPFYAARIFALFAAAGLLLLTLQKWGQPLSLRAAIPSALLLCIGFAVTPSGLAMRLIGGQAVVPQTPQFYASSPQHLFWVRSDTNGVPQSLMFDRYSMSATGTGAQRYMRLMAHLPLLLHPHPQQALLICFGVGNTADAIRMHDSVRQVDVVDLNPEVYRLNPVFSFVNDNVLADAKMRLYVDDGRQFLKLTTNRYGLVTMEPPPPLHAGVSRLYSQEFYRDIQSHLAPGGMVSQWIPEFNVTTHAVELIFTTFVASFPHSFAFVGADRNLILVGSNEPFNLDTLRDRFPREKRVRADLKRMQIERPADLLLSVLESPASLRRKWGSGPTIRDGRASLDTILISPVQMFGPRQDFRRNKEKLRREEADVENWILEQTPALFDEYKTSFTSVQTQRWANSVMPACYRK